ncbi:MAG: ATP-binding protein [Actinobacteria bacterium]|nr:ATP-binding protein [Actinomycetota bacterium]
MDEQKTLNKYEDILRQYNILNQISRVVASTLDLNKILQIVLAGVTFGDGFGFNRAFLFLTGRESKLVGKMAIGPESPEEAWRVWSDIQKKNYSLEEFLSSDRTNFEQNSLLNERTKQVSFTIDPDKLIARSLEDGNPRNIDLTQIHPPDNNNLVTDRSMIDEEILEFVGYPKFCILPLISRTKKVGILIVDNKYNNRDITKDDINFLFMLSQFAASSIRNTIINSQLRESLASLAKFNQQISYLKEYNENIIESIPVSIFVVDTNFKITACNENFAKIIQLPKSSILGININNLGLNIGEFNIFQEISNVMSDRKTEGFYRTKIEINNQVNDSLYDVILVTFKNSKDEIDGVIAIVEEVTKTVELERALKESERLSQLGRLSAIVAHEIRNPLIAIGGYVNRVRRKYSEGNGLNQEDMDIIINEIGRLENILNDMLDFASNRKTEFNQIDFGKLIQECISLVSVAAEKANVAMAVNCENGSIEESNIVIDGSYDNLKQAFINLLNNAIEASTSKDTVNVNIYTSDIDSQKMVEVKINSKSFLSGEKDLNDIFLPFYTTKVKGTGLGLTITKKIIEEHSGKIEVESNPEEGTTFTIKLPLLELIK